MVAVSSEFQLSVSNIIFSVKKSKPKTSGMGEVASRGKNRKREFRLIRRIAWQRRRSL